MIEFVIYRMVLVLSTLGVACAEQPGTFGVQLTWPSDADAPLQVFLRGRIELGDGGGATVQSETVGPVSFGASVVIPFERVPHGKGHILEVEVLRAPDSEFVLYFGRSAPFDLEAGRATTVEMPVGFVNPPEGRIVLERGVQVVNHPSVVLRLWTDTGVLAELSNFPDFADAHPQELLAAEEARCPPPANAKKPGLCSYRVTWNLNRGLDDKCVESDTCPRQVFVRYRDRDNLRSATSSIGLTLDTFAPVVVVHSFAPETLASEGVGTVQFSLQERVRAGDVELRAAPHIAPHTNVRRVFPGSAEQQTGNFSFQVAPAAGRWPAELSMSELGLTVFARDLAGNVAEASSLKGLEIDPDVPRVVLSIESAVRSPSAPDLHFTFTVSEPLSGLVVEAFLAGNRLDTGPNDLPVGCRAESSREVRCTVAVGGNAFPIDEVATRALLVRARDGAGNEGRDDETISWDARAPRVVPDSVAVRMFPSAANPLPSVRSVRDDTVVEVSFVLDEVTALGATQLRTASPAFTQPALAEWTLLQQTGSSFLFRFDFAAATSEFLPEGAYLVEVSTRDEAGNAATFPLPLPADGLVIDRSAPAAARVDVPDALVLHRQPWGTSSFVSSPQLEVEIGPGGVPDPDATIVIVRTSAGKEAARAAVESNGSVRGRLPLVAGDAPFFDVVVVDGAGNESLARRIRDGRWTATVAGRENGSAANPHTFYSTVLAKPTLFQRPDEVGTEPPGLQVEKLSQRGGTPLTILGERPWTILEEAVGIVVGFGQPIAFDPLRGVGVFIQGRGRASFYEDSGFGWQRVPAGGAIPGDGENGFFDMRRGRMVFSDFLRNVFEWDGRQVFTTSRTILSGAGATIAGAVFDPVRGRGYGVGATGDREVRVYDITGPDQPVLIPANGNRPQARPFRYRSALNTGSGEVMVLFRDPDASLNLWAFNPESGRWRQDASLVSTPGSELPVVCYDQRRDRLVAATWSRVDGGSIFEWVPESGEWSNPLPYFEASRRFWGCYWDAIRQEVVFTEWVSSLRQLQWNGASLRLRTYRAPGPGDTRADLFFDPTRGTPVLFAPRKGSSFEFVEQGWTSVGDTTPAIPAFRDVFGDAMLRGAWDELRGEYVVHAGGTYTWQNGHFQLKTDASPPSAPGPDLAEPALGWDAAEGVVVLFGGRRLESPGSSSWIKQSDTWTWDGAGWTHHPPPVGIPQPARRIDHDIVTDPVTGHALLVGGMGDRVGPNGEPLIGLLQDMWLWRGHQWEKIEADPSGIGPGPLVYDQGVGSIVLLTGLGVFEWWASLESRGSRSRSWIPTNRSSPPPRHIDAAVYDPVQERIVGWTRDNRTVIRKSSPTDRPAGIFSVAWGAAGVDISHVQKIQFDVFAGGQGRAPMPPGSHVALNGAEMQVWDPRSSTWVDVATHTNALIGHLQHVATGENARVLLLRAPQEFYVRVLPRGGFNGTMAPSVSVDYVQATVAYRLPGSLP